MKYVMVFHLLILLMSYSGGNTESCSPRVIRPSETVANISETSDMDIEKTQTDKLKLLVKCVLRDGDDLPIINANLEIPGILEGNLFHKSKSNGEFEISEIEVSDFPAGVHDVYVTAISNNGTTIQEIVSCDFSGNQISPYVIKLKTKLDSSPNEIRPCHVNIVLQDADGIRLPDLWIMTKRVGERPSAGYLDDAYGYTNDLGTFIWWNALSAQYNCTVYSDATYDPDYQLASFLIEIKDQDHSYEYCFEIKR